MDTTGLEPVTPTMSTWCSNQLSYASSTIYHRSIEVMTLARFFLKKSGNVGLRLGEERQKLMPKKSLDPSENLIIEGEVHLSLLSLAGEIVVLVGIFQSRN